MRASLQVISSPSRPRRFELREGQAARFGRSDWADCSFREDMALADIHFVVACLPAGCFLRHLAPGLQTLVNDTPVHELRLKHGDRITAGRTIFSVTIDGDSLVASSKSADGLSNDSSSAQGGPPALPASHWLELAELLNLDPPARELIQDPQTVEDWIQALIEKRHFRDAARLRADTLDRRSAVWWGCLCVETDGIVDRLPPPQKLAYETAREWVITQTELARRQAESAIVKAKKRGIGASLANGAFWAGPTLGPPDAEPIPPDPKLTGLAITNTLVLASIEQSPKLAAQRWPKFLELGQSVADGKLPWPAPPAKP